MLGFIAGAAAWGFLKAWADDAQRSHDSLAGLGVGEFVEELQFRAGLEGGLKKLNMAPVPARALGAAAFGLMHPGNVLDAALGGVLYSFAYEKHGLLGSTLTHLAHNLGVYFGGRNS